MNFYTNKQHGFTLIELLVVIAIIGTLASVVLASLNSAREKSRNASTEAAVKEIDKGLNLYYSEYGRYPRNNSWDCMGADSDNDGACWSGGGTYVYSNNHADLANLTPYINHGDIPVFTEGSGVEGFLYGSRNSGSGYELIYILEGTNRECGAGFNRNANQNSSGNTTCTVCSNYSGSNCVDRF